MIHLIETSQHKPAQNFGLQSGIFIVFSRGISACIIFSSTKCALFMVTRLPL